MAIPSASGLNNPAAGAPSLNSLVSFLVGAHGTYQRGVGYPGFAPPQTTPKEYWRRRSWAGWFQDDIKATRQLTLNLGLRYEFNGAIYEANGLTQGIVDDPHFEGGSLYRRLVINADPLYYPDYNGWEPRFGFAYKAAAKTVVRGGFGGFTNLPLAQTGEQQGFGGVTGTTPAPSW